MSSWYHILVRSALRPGCSDIRSSVKLFVENQGVFPVVNKSKSHGNRNIYCSASAVQIKIQSNSYATQSNLRLDNNNTLRSFHENLDINQELLHEFIWKNLDRWPDKTAVICAITGKSYTYSRLRKLSGKFATSLRKFKLNPGSTIAVILPNVPEYSIIILGASEAGCKITTCNPIYTKEEIKRQLDNSDASAVITTTAQYPVVKESISTNSNIKLPIIVIDDTTDSLPNGSIRFGELISDSVEVFNGSAAENQRSIEDTILLPYSSGTTGLPKGVKLSHRNIVMNCRQLQAKGFNSGHETTETHQDVVPLILPAFHIYGLTVVFLNYLSTGAKIVCLPKFNPEGFLKCLKEFNSTNLYVAPPLLIFLANSELVTKHHLESIRYVMSGAAPIGSESVQRLLKKAKREIMLAQGYGLTETSPVISTSSNGLDNLDAVGYIVPNTKLRVVGIDDSNAGRNLGINELGEIYVKGPQVMKGYYKNPEATANSMDGEWFKTGDIGCYDDIGHIFIKDRLKELIKVKGFQVPPAELEELVRSNEDVFDVGITGEAHPRFGEIPKAYIVCKPGVKPDADKIMKFVAERVAKYKQLGSIKFVDEIPRNASGKILRRQLKNL